MKQATSQDKIISLDHLQIFSDFPRHRMTNKAHKKLLSSNRNEKLSNLNAINEKEHILHSV